MNNTLLQVPGFKTWLASRLCANLARRTLALIVSWQVYDITHQPLALGLIGLFEAVPYVAVALWAGHFADRYDKRRIIIWALAASFWCSTILVLLPLAGDLKLALIYVVLALLSVCMSFEMASASAYGQTLVTNEQFPQAAAWHLTTFQVATISGPLIGGWMISDVGLGAAYMLTCGLFGAATLLARRLKHIPAAAVASGSPAPSSIEGQTNSWRASFEEIKVGLKFILQNRIMLAAMCLDMVAVLFGDVVAILPIFAGMMSAGPVGLGILRAAPAVGSFLLSTAYAYRVFFRYSWSNLLRSIALFGLFVICFALSKNFVLSVIFLGLSGVADGVSVIVRSSLYQAMTPNHLRGRVASVNGIFIRISNELGAFESGLAAQLLGAIPSVIFGGLMTWASVLFLKWKFPSSSFESK